MNKSQQILKAADEIEALLEKHQVPSPNQNVVNAFKSIAARLTPIANYPSGLVWELTDLAEKFYSHRKHEKHGDADAIYSRMRHELLERIRDQAPLYENSENDA
jgi:hypothetical protein